MIKTKEEVRRFIDEVHKYLEESPDNLKIEGRTRNEDKTYNFRSHYGISEKIICEELLKLDISNYSKTEYDKEPRWSHEEVWIFGLDMIGLAKSKIEVYIKLKIRKRVICLSFHPSEYRINYPYLNL